VNCCGFYFDGLYFSDTQRLRRAMHPQARYICAKGDPLINIGMKDYLAIVDKRPARPAPTRSSRSNLPGR
jgi:4-oxalocrotonate tautomerase